MSRFDREEDSLVGKSSGDKRCKPGDHAEKCRHVARKGIVKARKNLAAAGQGSDRKQRCFHTVCWVIKRFMSRWGKTKLALHAQERISGRMIAGSFTGKDAGFRTPPAVNYSSRLTS